MRTRSLRAPAGFSLIELLIAMTVSVMLVGAVYAAYLGTSQAWERSRVGSTHYQSARVALETIERYLMGSVAPGAVNGAVFEGESRTFEDAEERHADRLAFCSTGGRISRRSKTGIDFAEVAFFLNEDPAKPDLLMRKRMFPMSEPWRASETSELAPGVASLRFRYFDGMDWVDDWAMQQSLPLAVEVTLVFLDPEERANPMKFQKLITIPTASVEETKTVE